MKTSRTMKRDLPRTITRPRIRQFKCNHLPYYFHLYSSPPPHSSSANSISPPKLVRGSTNFLSVPSQNKLWNEALCGQVRNKTDERELRARRGRRLQVARSSLSPPRALCRSTWRRPRELSSRFIVTYTSAKICFHLKLSCLKSSSAYVLWQRVHFRLEFSGQEQSFPGVGIYKTSKFWISALIKESDAETIAYKVLR